MSINPFKSGIWLRLRRWQETSRLGSLIYLLPCFLSLFGLDVAFRFIYHDFGVTSFFSIVPIGFSFGWCLLLTGVACLLPAGSRRVYMLLVSLVFCVIVVADGIMINLFRRFFSFADLGFAGDGAAFLEVSYLLLIRKVTVAAAIFCFLLMVLACILVLRKRAAAPALGKKYRYLTGAAMAVLGVAIVVAVRVFAVGYTDTVIWDYSGNTSAIYDDTSDTKSSLLLSGLYHYTFRDLWLTLDLFSGASEQDIVALDEYFASMAYKNEDNEMTGIFEGKNLIFVQLEAIDTWMLTADYMPALYEKKQESIVFANHYTPAYITAGTFNTEFITQTGLLPALAGVSTSVYSSNTFSVSLPSLLSDIGYTSRSFHGSEGEIYNRAAIHENLGFERYYSGDDMDMGDYTLDSRLINAFDLMTESEPFYSLVITFSGHGPYDMSTTISQAHYDEALKVATRSEDSYIHAVAHAMETDLFVEEFFEELKESGLYDDTVVVFFADHYNYYMLNDSLNMEIKDIYDLNLLQHTDFFIWSADTGHMQVDKVTSSLDVVPTVVNLFGLEADMALYFGNDAFSDYGGYVFFADSSWYDGVTYFTTGSESNDYTNSINEEIASLREHNKLALKTDYYY